MSSKLYSQAGAQHLTNDKSLDAPRDLSSPTDKSGLMTSLDLPTGVDIQDRAPQALTNKVSPQDSNTSGIQPTPPSKSVRINETVITANSPVGVPQGMANSPKGVTRQSILMSSSINAPADEEPEEYDASPPTKGPPSKIHNPNQKLYQVFSKDGLRETAYHVTDFAGFYPVWPIVKFSMAPTGATKDERMTSFIKCVTALLGKMLYVNCWGLYSCSD
jgi:hypothetical protein